MGQAQDRADRTWLVLVLLRWNHLFLFLIQVGTGILLMFYYKGSSDTAFESVRFISSKVPFGWLIRSVHAWSANLMILSAFVHMFSVFFMRAYRKPRELTWVSGNSAPRDSVRLRIQRLPLAMERARLLCHEGRHQHHRYHPVRRGSHHVCPARWRGGDRVDPSALLCASRRALSQPC